MKTARERDEEKRAEKLEQVREQVESGSLVIREMTARSAGVIRRLHRSQSQSVVGEHA